MTSQTPDTDGWPAEQVDSCVEGLQDFLALLAREYEALHERGMREGFGPGSAGFDEGKAASLLLRAASAVKHMLRNMQSEIMLTHSTRCQELRVMCKEQLSKGLSPRLGCRSDSAWPSHHHSGSAQAGRGCADRSAGDCPASSPKRTKSATCCERSAE